MQKLFFKVIIFSFGSILSTLPSIAQPAICVDKIFSTPDFTQTDPRGHFAAGGKNYCAPVAVSNSFVWLSKHGFPGLMPGNSKETKIGQDDKKLIEQQIELIKILASPAYMNTRAEDGTEVANIVKGIKKYVLGRGYEIKQLSYQGFRMTDPEFDSGLKRPRVPWIKNAITGNSVVWLNIGWYKHKPDSTTYIRIGGHWVTLVGYGKDAQNQAISNVFVVHNPSQLAGTSFHNDFLTLAPVNNGVLVSHRILFGFPRPSFGFYQITSGLPPIPDCNTAILEGAVMLELR